MIVRNETAGEPIHDKTDYSELLALSDKLELVCAHGEKFSNYEKEISGKFYVLGSNPMGIKKFRLVFDESGGKFEYTNIQGDKVLPFGRCENVFCLPAECIFSKFPTVLQRAVSAE